MKTLKELKSEANRRWTEFTIKTKAKVHEAYVWASNNRDEAALIVTVGLATLGAVGKAVRSVDRKMDLKKEQDLKDLYVYDRSLGIYHELRRKLKPSEVQEIDHRRANGESMTHILANMRLLK